jgi:hypothetical protein
MPLAPNFSFCGYLVCLAATGSVAVAVALTLPWHSHNAAVTAVPADAASQ